MEDLKKKSTTENDKEIVFSKAIKAGKRIYYVDVRKNRKNDMFLAITESKKVVNGEGDSSLVSFEKHKIFVYKEDLRKLMDGLNEAISYIENDGTCEYQSTDNEENDFIKENDYTPSDEIKIDIDF